MTEQYQVEGSGISGTIPTTVGLLTNLSKIWIRLTSVTGTVPSEFGNISGLQEFSIVRSDLIGTIPTEFGNMKGLSEYNSFGLSFTSASVLAYPETDNFHCSPTDIINIHEAYEINGTLPEALCGRARTQALHVIHSCTFECECCADPCLKLTYNSNGKTESP